MMSVNLLDFEPLFFKHMKTICDEVGDVSHDLSHVLRVVSTAKTLCFKENGDFRVVVPASYLHDCLYISKKDPRRHLASTLSADYAVKLLNDWGYPDQYFEGIRHAIKAHSFSANIKPKTLEAKIVQDADRIDGLGAIGISRAMAFSGFANRSIYSVEDPFCEYGREPNDSTNTLDHFFIKLMKVAELACTNSGKIECLKRTDYMAKFLDQLKKEVDFNQEAATFDRTQNFVQSLI